MDGVTDKKEIASLCLPACASAVALIDSYTSKQIIIFLKNGVRLKNLLASGHFLII